MSYAGGFPGPVLRLHPGESLNLKFDNRLDEATNLHFHGLYVSPSGRADNIWVVAPPGAGFEYELPVASGNDFVLPSFLSSFAPSRLCVKSFPYSDCIHRKAARTPIFSPAC